MPIIQSKDTYGSYYRWGHQKKYYYIPGNAKSRTQALNKCKKQARAIQWSINNFKRQ